MNKNHPIFRVYSRTHKKYIKNGILANNIETGEWVSSSIETGGLIKGEVILEQFTGLIDKNGKKIFEGDIIKTYWYDELANWDDLNKLKTILPVTYDTRTAQFMARKDLFECFAFYAHENCQLTEAEVIGNIHENPELLK